MRTRLKCLIIFGLLFPVLIFGKSTRKPAEDSKRNGIKDLQGAVQNVESDLLSAPEVTRNQKNIFTAISYSLFSPTFDSEGLGSQNQESLGLSIMLGFSYLPYTGWGFQSSLGLLQNSKTDRSLPDFVLAKPSASLSFSISRSVYLTGGIFSYTQHGEALKNFQSYIGQEFFFGYKANKKINIKFGYTVSRFSSDFNVDNQVIHSLVSLRGLESQLVYLF